MKNLDTIKFLQEKLTEQVALKVTYLSKPHISVWEQVNLNETLKEIEFYSDAIATIRAFNKITKLQDGISNWSSN